jgi:hypothetical protein
MWVFRSFPQENEKNNRATRLASKLISVALDAENPRHTFLRGMPKPALKKRGALHFSPVKGTLYLFAENSSFSGNNTGLYT